MTPSEYGAPQTWVWFCVYRVLCGAGCYRYSWYFNHCWLKHQCITDTEKTEPLRSSIIIIHVFVITSNRTQSEMMILFFVISLAGNPHPELHKQIIQQDAKFQELVWSSSNGQHRQSRFKTLSSTTALPPQTWCKIPIWTHLHSNPAAPWKEEVSESGWDITRTPTQLHSEVPGELSVQGSQQQCAWNVSHLGNSTHQAAQQWGRVHPPVPIRCMWRASGTRSSSSHLP